MKHVLDPIWRLERAQQTTIFRLRTGHCGLSDHPKRTGISDTSLCECGGQADQTPDYVLHLLTYLCPWLPVEHRPSTTPRHRTLFWAALVIPDQLVPCCLSSASVSRLQLLRGRPLFFFPRGFQVRAWRVVLDAGFLREIQAHFLRSICLATGSCPARSHSSSDLHFGSNHVLQSCPEYAERRQLTWLQGADLANKLWGSTEGLYRTAGFVASTGLKI